MMFLKKSEAPRTVILKDGRVLSQADLPPVGTTRWVASRKANVVWAVAYGLISMEAALDRYKLSEEEFNEWASAIQNHGLEGLKTTGLQRFRNK